MPGAARGIERRMMNQAIWYFPSCNFLIFDWGTHLHVLLSSAQLLSHVWLPATPCAAVQQSSLSITNSQKLLKIISLESVMPSNHLILCHPLFLLPSIFPSIRVFLMSRLFTPGGQSIGASASASVNIQDWFPLGLTGLISLQSNGLSRVFSNTQFKSINSLTFSLLFGPTLTSIHDWKTIALTIQTFVGQKNVSAF